MTTKPKAHRRTVIVMLRLTPTEHQALKREKLPHEALTETCRRLMALKVKA